MRFTNPLGGQAIKISNPSVQVTGTFRVTPSPGVELIAAVAGYFAVIYTVTFHEADPTNETVQIKAGAKTVTVTVLGGTTKLENLGGFICPADTAVYAIGTRTRVVIKQIKYTLIPVGG